MVLMTHSLDTDGLQMTNSELKMMQTITSTPNSTTLTFQTKDIITIILHKSTSMKGNTRVTTSF